MVQLHLSISEFLRPVSAGGAFVYIEWHICLFLQLKAAIMTHFDDSLHKKAGQNRTQALHYQVYKLYQMLTQDYLELELHHSRNCQSHTVNCCDHQHHLGEGLGHC